MTIVLGTLILAVFLIGCVGLVADLNRACAEAQHELELDDLWDDGDETELAASPLCTCRKFAVCPACLGLVAGGSLKVW